MSLAAALETELRRLVREVVREELGAVGAGEYSSVAPPTGVSRRAFREGAARMLAAGVAGVRREGRGRRDAVWIVDRQAWHRWRTTTRAETKAAGPSDEDLAERALGRAGLRLVGGAR